MSTALWIVAAWSSGPTRTRPPPSRRNRARNVWLTGSSATNDILVLEVVPTRLLTGETIPLVPIAPSPHVAAPALARAPLCQLKFTATKLPFESAVTPLLPIASLALEPTRLLAAEITPLTPIVPLPQDTAPALTMAPLSQLELTTT